jgi:hypothetical protein
MTRCLFSSPLGGSASTDALVTVLAISTDLNFFMGGIFADGSPDLRFLETFASMSVESLGFWEGGEDEGPRWNLRAGIFGFLASSARR